MSTPQQTPITNPAQQQFCVRWNSYQSNLQNAFPKLLTSEHFVDVTLACENEMIKCHKVVLSACSTYFEKLLVQNPCQHPIIFMKDMKFIEMQALVDFMYKGEVNVTQDELPSLLRSAEALQIRGLCGSDQLLNSHYLTQQNNAPQANGNGRSSPTTNDDKKIESIPSPKPANLENGRLDTIKREEPLPSSEAGSTPPLSIKEDPYDADESYYDQDVDMDGDFLDQDEEDAGTSGVGLETKPGVVPEYAMANVSCQYNEGSPMQAQRRIRRSEAELRSAAECITRGQTFQTVSDQFNIPISTIRFYMARKGILPRRKRGRACSMGPQMSGILSSPGNGMGHGTPLSSGSQSGYHSTPGNTSPVGPPYHIVHYKLPVLGAKLK